MIVMRKGTHTPVQLLISSRPNAALTAISSPSLLAVPVSAAAVDVGCAPTRRVTKADAAIIITSASAAIVTRRARLCRRTRFCMKSSLRLVNRHADKRKIHNMTGLFNGYDYTAKLEYDSTKAKFQAVTGGRWPVASQKKPATICRHKRLSVKASDGYQRSTGH